MLRTLKSEMWFGTVERAGFIRTPNTQADMSPAAWAESGVMLNGGGYGFHSRGSHKTYGFEWPDSSSRAEAQRMKSYFEGTYGRGLIYFVDPLIYDQNVLPARWADPSIALDSEGASLVYGVEPTLSGVSDPFANDLPIQSVTYDLTNVASGFRGTEDAVFLPVPEGYTLYLGAMYSATGSGGIFISPQTTSIGSPTRLTEIADSATDILVDSISGVRGVWLWVGKTSSGAASVTIRGLIARIHRTPVPGGPIPGDEGYGLEPYGETPYGGEFAPRYQPTPEFFQGPWMGGMGHSGCRFVQPPTYIANTGLQGGRIGYSASFIEVGSWVV